MSEEMIVRHCSPTLAGLKTGNLFVCSFSQEATLRTEICRLNRRLGKKGVCILPLRMKDGSALIYVYRPKRLATDFSREEVLSLLRQHGYFCSTSAGCILRLMERLKNASEFPHEIGLFLGYPPEDVNGFIENKAKAAKCTGAWKVYGDEAAAKTLFAKYKKCTDVYLSQLIRGNTIDRLTVKV